MDRSRALAAFIGAVGVAALGSVAMTAANASATTESYRSPQCSPRKPQTSDVVYAERGYRRVDLKRSWLRVGRRLGTGHGPGDPGICSTPICLPSLGPLECSYTPGKPETPGPEIAVYRLLAFRPTLALSRAGFSRSILVAENYCTEASSERALLRCLRSV
jgi:hypothetical protein